MNKFTTALAVGTVLAGGLAPRAHAASVAAGTGLETLNTPVISAADFNASFTPYDTAVTSPFRFDGASGDSGLIESQVFQGQGKYAGLYAYAYEVVANPTTDGGGEPVHVDSVSFKFNASPLNASTAGTPAYGFLVQNGQVGGLDASGAQTPTSLSFQPGQSTGFIRAQFVDPNTGASAIGAGTNSATFVLLTNQLPSTVTPSVNVGGGSAVTTVPVVYTTSPGTIEPVPAPEPTTVVAWAAMAGAVALARRFRTRRLAPA